MPIGKREGHFFYLDAMQDYGVLLSQRLGQVSGRPVSTYVVALFLPMWCSIKPKTWAVERGEDHPRAGGGGCDFALFLHFLLMFVAFC